MRVAVVLVATIFLVAWRNLNKISVNRWSPFSNTTTTQPNIVIIVADDLGYNDVSWHNPVIKSPHLESLAKNGVLLEQHYSQPLCTPTRAALLTGR